MNKRKLTESIKGLPFNPRDRKTFIEEVSQGGGINDKTPIKEELTGEELVPIFDGENKAVKIGSLLNINNEDLPTFTLNLNPVPVVTVISGTQSRITSYDLTADIISPDKVVFVDNKVKIALYFECNIFKTLEPIIIEGEYTKIPGTAYPPYVNINTTFNNIKVLYYNKYESYINGTIESKLYSASLTFKYYLKLSNDTEILINQMAINDSTKVQELLGLVTPNVKPCKFILNGEKTVVYGIVDGEDPVNTYINVILNSNIYKYNITDKSIVLDKTIIATDDTLELNVDNDELDASISYGRISSKNIKNLYFILNGAKYLVKSISNAEESDNYYVTFGDDILYKYKLKCYPKSAIPITFGVKIVERKSIDLNSLI